MSPPPGAPEFRIGCSGWSYQHWRDDFYPAGLASGAWLEHYASVFDTVELNASFYRLPSAAAVAGWQRRTPPGFRFSVKASRLITHFHQLVDCEDALRTFLARIRGLGPKLGPVLFQTPPSLQRDDERLRRFLALLPLDCLSVFEFRHASWWVEPVQALLREHGAGFCIYNLGQTTTPVVATCPDAYLRLHGPSIEYASGYDDAALTDWASKLADLGAERVWVYFNNDIGGHAPRDAVRLREIVNARASTSG